jgi:uncharacterized damage-inducible protein DinB
MKQRTQVLHLGLSLIALCACSLVGLAQAASGTQQAPAKEWPKDRIGGIVAEWTRAKNWTKEYIDKMPEDAMSFKPIPEVRSFAEQMLHLASANFFYCQLGTGQKNPYKREDFAADKFKTKAELTKMVMESYDFMIEGVKTMTDAKLEERSVVRGTSTPRAELLVMGFEHQTHHRGQTTIYLRMKGVTPPPEPF